MQGTKTHRDRKNGASREEWVARKAARNAAKVVVSKPRFLDQVAGVRE
jgi:hypothetical protein